MSSDKILALLKAGVEPLVGGAAACLGLVASSPVVIAAGTIAPLAEAGLKRILGDVAERQLSHDEQRRMGGAAVHAVNQIYLRLIAGEIPRQDGFFESLSDDRSPAQTAFEGVLQTCRVLWEQKKLPFVANIYANAYFSDAAPQVIYRVIVLAERITWRQVCLLSMAGRTHEPGIRTDWMNLWKHDINVEQDILRTEVNELFPTKLGLIDVGRPGPARTTNIGKACFDLMGLGDVPMCELEQVVSIF